MTIYMVRKQGEDFWDYVKRRAEKLEPHVATHIIRQLLKMIPADCSELELVKDARHFISGGGRTGHWEDRDIYFEWHENSCRYVSQREIDEYLAEGKQK